MPKQTQGSGSDPAARIFNRALHDLKQTPSRSGLVHPNSGLKNVDSQKSVLALASYENDTSSKSDLVHASNGLKNDDSLLQKSIFGSNISVSLEWSPGKSSEVSKIVEIRKVDNRDKSPSSDYSYIGISDNLSNITEQKENVTSHSPVSHSEIGNLAEHTLPNVSSGQPRRKMKSVIAIIHNHLSDDNNSGSSKPMKRSYSEPVNSRTNKRSATEAFMSERGSDTALLQPEPRHRFQQPELEEMTEVHHSTPRNLNENLPLKSTSFESYTPNSRFSDRRIVVRHHHRSLTYPNSKRCAADVTPYSPSSRSSESSPMRRMKRIRTGAYIPSYDLKDLSLKFPVRVIDSHCHLDFLFTREDYHESYSDYRSKYSETFPACYEGCITIFCEPQNFSMKRHWDPILQEDGVWAAFGCHPHMARNYNDESENALLEAMKDPKVVALGEVGLDYSKRNNCDRDRQKKVLRRQLKIALDHKRPLVIHCREAHDDCIEIIRELVPRKHFIHLHCFTDTWERAEEWLKEFPNLYIGITNLVTFPTAEEVHDIARKIPIERLLLETDTPYFVPKLLTMRWSHPGMVIHAAAQIAAFRTEVSIQDLLRTVRENTYKVYGI